VFQIIVLYHHIYMHFKHTWNTPFWLTRSTQTGRYPFKGLVPGEPGYASTRKIKQMWMMGWQWHQLDHMQIICTSLQTD